MKSLYFDGRKDATLTIEKKSGRSHRKNIQEEHVPLISEPGGIYIGHITPKSGTASAIKEAILKYIQ